MSQEIIERISILETKLEAHSQISNLNQVAMMNLLNELKQGIGKRVEDDGKDIAVLKNNNISVDKKIESLENSRTWVIVAIIGSFFSAIWALIVGKKST